MGKGYKYLGKRVKDIGKKGLDRPSEVKGIAEAILRAYKNGEITYRTAMSELNLLELIVQSSSKFTAEQKKRLRSLIDKTREKLKEAKRKKRSVSVPALPTFRLPVIRFP